MDTINPKNQSRKQNAEDLLAQCLMPRRTFNALSSIEAVRRAFGLPANMSGLNEDRRLAMDDAFSDAGGFDAIYNSLQQHAGELGQYPITSFIGYGALQQIAQQGMIRACIQTVADDMARKWIKITSDSTNNEQQNEQISTFEKLCESKYHLRDIFHRAFATCGYMGGALIFIDTGADEDLSLPLAINNMSAELTAGAPLKFVLIDPVNASPAEYNCTNPLRDDYMQPKSWFILGQRVHASRLISIADNEPPLLLRPNYNFLGIPQAQILWDYVLHFNQTRVYTADLLRKISLLVVKTDMDALLSDPNGVANFDAKMQVLQRYRDNDAIFACDKEGEDVTNIQTSIAGCTDIVRQALEMIAAINRTPAVKLLGISPSGFNATGESDLKNYYDMIAAKQNTHREAVLTCLKCVQLTEWGEIDEGLGFDFVSLDEENRASQAMTAQTKLGAWAQLADRQAMSAEELRQMARLDPDIGLSALPEDMPEPEPESESGFFPGGGDEGIGGAEGADI